MAEPVPWRSRIVGHRQRSPARLRANPKNWRTHPPEQRAALVRLLDEVGWVQDVVWNRRTNTLLDGHLRVELAIERGEKTIPVVEVDLSEAEEALILATLDPLTSMAGVDSAMLESLIGEIELPPDDLGAILQELAGLSAVTETAADPNEVLEPVEAPYVKPGDLYALGVHRLLCGDATDAGDVARVLDGEKPKLMITDPPYGVEYDPTWRSKNRIGSFEGDDRADWREAYALAPGDVAYVWHASAHVVEVAAALDACGYDRRAYLIWAKQNHTFGRGHYHWQHEPCWYAVRKGAKAEWAGDRKQTTLWQIDNIHPTLGTTDDRETIHSTQKPVECMERPMRNHKGDVYDPFVGSGTTLIAAERLGRRCYAMDIDPRYAQLAIERWGAYTGERAVKLDA